MSSYPKKLNGLCVGILSGDRVLFQGPPDTVNGGYKQKILHLSGIQASKVDTVNGNDQKFGFTARQFLRKRLVGKQLQFIIEKKVNEIQLGYVFYEGKDITIQLLSRGYAKLRAQNIKCDHIDQYKNAEEQARMAENGIWSEQKKVQGAFRYLAKNIDQKQLSKKYQGKSLKGIVEQIHPSKAQIYFPSQGIITTVTFSEVQVVVLSQKVNNETVKSNVRQIRSVLQSSFLQKEVDVHISGYGQTLTGYLQNSSNQDVRKILLKNGFAKLGKEAMNTTSTKQFMQLKKISQLALQAGKGLWKQQQVTKSQALNQKSFIGTVVQVHSGDSLSVINPQKNTVSRFFFPNARAPAANLPWAFESKQALRRKAVGQKVKVEVEFSKNINVKTGEGQKTQARNFVYASVFLQNTNLACYLLEQGLLNLQAPRAQQDVTKYFEELRQAQQKGKKQRKGINNKQNIKVPSFNDLSGGKGKKIDASKAKNIFPFLKDQKNLSGVIDLVLNGSRFKVRFNSNPVMAVMVLDGVRALPNQGQFKKISEQALQYSKNNALQRDVQIQLKKVDQKGVFQGVIYINKRDYAIQLLQRGLAICMGRSNKKYEDAEALARKNKTGLWAYNLNLSSLKGDSQKQFNDININRQGSIIEVNSRNQFYIQPKNCKRVQVPQNVKLAQKIQVGQLYAAQFDGQYYRGRIMKQLMNQKYQVFFIDYGNYDNVPKSKIGQLPQNLKKQKAAVFKCSLYGLDGITQQGQKTLKDLIGANLKIEFKQQSELVQNEETQYKVVIWQKNTCINLQLLQFGDAECTTNIQTWTHAQEKARQNRQGKWAHDD